MAKKKKSGMEPIDTGGKGVVHEKKDIPLSSSVQGEAIPSSSTVGNEKPKKIVVSDSGKISFAKDSGIPKGSLKAADPSSRPKKAVLDKKKVAIDHDPSDDESLYDEDFPALPVQNPSSGHIGTSSSAPPQIENAVNKVTAAVGIDRTTNVPRPNVWVNAPKRVFMNSGLGGKLSYTPPTSNSVAIKVSEGLSKQSVWGWSLLGQYVGYHPGHLMINTMIRSWGVRATYRVEEGWFIFQFESEDDQDKVLKGGPYFIYGKPMILKHIPDKFAFNRRDIATIPLWVRIYGLARTFWTPEVLGRIASHIGKPLFMDPVTDNRKRGSYARILVEINFAEPIIREVGLRFDDGEVRACNFLIENEPRYCKRCCSFGHLDEECSFKEKRNGFGVNSRRSSQPPKGIAMSEKPNLVAAVTEPSPIIADVPPGNGDSMPIIRSEKGTKRTSRTSPLPSSVVRTIPTEKSHDLGSEDSSSGEENDAQSDEDLEYSSDAGLSSWKDQCDVDEGKFEKMMTKAQKKEEKMAQVREVVHTPKRWPKEHAPHNSKKNAEKKTRHEVH